MNAKPQDPLDWQIAVNRTLQAESPKRFSDTRAVLSEVEMEEATKAHASGMSAEAFGHLVAERDRKVEAYAQWIESAPVNRKARVA